jgi:N-acetylneuraminic acid mutarotase
VVTQTWVATGSMTEDQPASNEILLPNGNVLNIGGPGNGYSIPVSLLPFDPFYEIYDPLTATWATMAGSVYVEGGNSSTLLSNGTVLVAGGANPAGTGPGCGLCALVSAAYIYDPNIGSWNNTGSMNTARASFSATLLTNGTVLAAGGEAEPSLASAELYDPTSGIWTPTGDMTTGRTSQAAILLQDGTVLVVGGDATGTTAELYNPNSGLWTATGSMATTHLGGSVTLLPNGTVLVAGGLIGIGSTASAEIYNPATGTWAITGSMSTPREDASATLLPNGTVLVAGGANFFNSEGQEMETDLASAEVYNPSTGTWAPTGPMTSARVGAAATLLPNGTLLVAGGAGLSSAEIYYP